MVTDHAHLIALNRFTGELLWDTEMADWRQNYNATSAPLIVGDLVVSGTAGGEQGVRGFLAAYDQATGKEAWRFWTVPKPGEPGSETWIGTGIEHPGGVTWMTGVYDPAIAACVLDDRQPEPRLQRRRSSRRQFVRELRRCARRDDGPAQVALPVHSAQRVGLGCAAADGAHRYQVGRAAAKAAGSGEPQRIFLRARSDRRKVAPRESHS